MITKSLIRLLLGVIALLAGVSVNLFSQKFDNLPDGTNFPLWEDSTRYSRVYHVARNNPKASDSNPGTSERPFLTINAAAGILKPGEKVIVHEGTYREWVIPAKGGTSASKMIAYEAATGEKVTIKGSEIWQPELKPGSGWRLSREDKNSGIWMADIPEKLFDVYNPFMVRNTYHYLTTYGLITDQEWMKRVMLFRGMIFIDGKPLKQVFDVRELTETKNAFWVEDPGYRIFLKFDQSFDPTRHVIEITAREQIFAPESYNLGYIRVSGFVFEQASDGLPVPQRAIVSTMRGHHWILENNTIEWANACGLDIGAQSWDAEVPENHGYHIVRNNIIRNCGICGIAGAYGVEFTLIEGNLIESIGSLNLERMWECMGIKFHSCKSSLIRKNIFRNLTHAGGLWLDCSNSNCRITNNVFANIQSLAGAFYSEMNYDLNLADHNIFWNIRVDQERPANDNSLRIYGPAVRADCNERLVVANNFFGNVENQAVSFNLAQSERRHEGRTGLCFSNAAFNNIFYNCPNRILLARINENKIDRNIYDIDDDNFSFVLQYPSPISYQNLSGWQDFLKLDTVSTQPVIDASFDMESCVLSLRIDGEMPDYNDITVNGLTLSFNYPGPLNKYSKKEAGKIELRVKFPLED